MAEKAKKFKRLFWDVETAPNIVFSWRVGNKINLSYENIITERAIICICFKYEGESKVHYLTWDKGNDKKMLEQFVKILNEADESVGHNSDQFDTRWVRARCILHGIPMVPDLHTLDTLKLSRKGFNFNSHRLNYLGQYLGLGEKIHTGFNLWKDIVLKNDKKAMDKMVRYCQQDVKLLEKVYQKLNQYTLAKSHKGVAEGGEPHHCPSCGHNSCISNGVRVMANGLKKHRLHCNRCGKYHSISHAVYEAVKEGLKHK